MDLIKKYIDSAIELENINQEGLSYRNNLNRNNRLADKLRNIAKTIESRQPEYRREFAGLLNHDNSNVRIWCAHHMLEVMTYDDVDRKNALLIIIHSSTEDTPNGIGNKYWLKDWFTKNPQDKLLL